MLSMYIFYNQNRPFCEGKPFLEVFISLKDFFPEEYVRNICQILKCQVCQNRTNSMASTKENPSKDIITLKRGLQKNNNKGTT